MNLYLVIAGAAVVLASYAGTFYVGADYGESKALARQNSTQEIVDEAVSKNNLALSDLVSKITVSNQTVYQKAIHEVRTNTVYADCRHTPSMLNAINKSITGRGDTAANPAGAGLSGSDTAGGRLLWGNDPKASVVRRPVPGLSLRGDGPSLPK